MLLIIRINRHEPFQDAHFFDTRPIHGVIITNHLDRHLSAPFLGILGLHYRGKDAFAENTAHNVPILIKSFTGNDTLESDDEVEEEGK